MAMKYLIRFFKYKFNCLDYILLGHASCFMDLSSFFYRFNFLIQLRGGIHFIPKINPIYSKLAISGGTFIAASLRNHCILDSRGGSDMMLFIGGRADRVNFRNHRFTAIFYQVLYVQRVWAHFKS